MTLHFPDQPRISEGELPSYKIPPVTEMTMGILFDGLTRYNSILAAGFWKKISSSYPEVEEQPHLAPTFETFGGSGAQPIQFELLTGPLPSRFFFLSEDGADLIQLQRDRLHFNWRRTSPNQDYPRYPPLRSKFVEAWDNLDRWSQDENIGRANTTQCEIAYVNRIPLVDGDGGACGLSFYFNWLSGLEGITEDGSLQFRRRLVDKDELPVGRMLFTLTYASDLAGQREAQLMLTVRGRPASASREDALAFLDEGRRLIVHTFTRITTAEAHEVWSKT